MTPSRQSAARRRITVLHGELPALNQYDQRQRAANIGGPTHMPVLGSAPWFRTAGSILLAGEENLRVV